LEAESCSKCNFHNHPQKSEIAKHGLAEFANTQKAERSRAKVILFSEPINYQKISRLSNRAGNIWFRLLQVTAANTDITGDGR
jgi:hypothetical protein